MARSRNRPRPHLAWLILLALGLLVLAATRVRAAPAGDRREPDAEVSEDDAADSGESDPAEADPSDEGGHDRDHRARTEDDEELTEPDQLADMIEDAPLDDPVLRDAIETGVVFASTAFADAAELSDLASRQQRPSRLGRLDLTVAWRRNYHLLPIGVVLGPPIAMRDATTYEPRIDDTFLVIATWRI